MMKTKRIMLVLFVVFMLFAPVMGFANGTKEGDVQSDGSGDGGSGEPVTISWYIRKPEPKNFDAVMEKLNERLNEKLNVTLDLKCLEPAVWKQKMPLFYAAGEEMDLTWAASWGGFKFVPEVMKGAFIELDDKLMENLKETKELIPQTIWDGIKVNGKQYSAPNYQITVTQFGINVRKDLVEKYNMDVESLKTIDGLRAAFEIIKENEPNVIPCVFAKNLIHTSYFSRTDEGIYKTSTNPQFEIDVNTLKVAPPDMEAYKVAREFFEKGYYSPDALTIEHEGEEFKKGKYFCSFSTYKPGGSADQSLSIGFEVINIPITEPILGNSFGTMTALPKTSRNPEKALQMWNLFNIDEELFNMLVYGLEGQDYVKTGENRIEPIENGYSLPAWMLGNQFTAYLLPGQPDDVWQETIRLNEIAKPNPLNGFVMDVSDLKVEVANIQAVGEEFDKILKNGLADVEETIARKNKKMKEAGYEKVVAAVEKQLAQWMAEQE
jgi:putative aldouronate transport system substrate-binding protein